MFVGQVIVGGVASLTVTVNVQLGVPPELAQVTVVVPLLNVEPDAGVQVIVPQFPLPVGVV